MKLQDDELEMLLIYYWFGQFRGVDVPNVANLIEKFQKEHEKIAPKIEGAVIKVNMGKSKEISAGSPARIGNPPNKAIYPEWWKDERI
jgi:hypothetical protein